MQDSPKHAVGRSLPRVDIIEKVTGAARYNRDSIPSNAMSLALAGSPQPHLKIHRIDITEALKVPGVIRVITAHDLPGPIALRNSGQPFLAGLESRYRGEPVALIVARNEEAARLAAERVKLESESLPAVTNIGEALAVDAPQVAFELERPNIWKHWSYTQGDSSAAFAESAQVVEQQFTTQGQTLDLLESPSIFTQIDPQDGLQIRGCTNHPYLIQDTVAHLLDLPHNRIQVIQHALRGNSQGYALRSTLLASYAALATWLTGHPVQLTLQRSEALRLFGHRPKAQVYVKYGADREGFLQACEIKVHLQAGAYPHDLVPLLHRTLAHACGPYQIPHFRMEVNAVATHTPPSALVFGYGQLATCFARESMLDQLSERLRMDPVILRQLNLQREGHNPQQGPSLDGIGGLAEALNAVLQAAEWSPPSKNPDEESPSEAGNDWLPPKDLSLPLERAEEEHTSSTKNTSSKAEEREHTSSSPELNDYSQRSKFSQENLPGAAFTWTGKPRRQKGWGVSIAHVGLTAGGEDSSPQAMASVQIQRDGTVLLNVPQVDAGSDNQTRLAQITAEVLAAPFESIRILDIDTTRLTAPTPCSLPTSMFLTGQALLKAAQPLREQMLQQAALQWNCEATQITTGVGRLFGPRNQTLSFSEVVELCWSQGLPMARYGFHRIPTTPSSPGEEFSPQSVQYPAYAYAAYFAEVELDLDSQEIEHLTLYIACDIGKVLNPTLARNQLVHGAYRGLAYTLFETPDQQEGREQMLLSHPLRSLGQIPQIHPILIEQPHADGPLGHKGLDYLPTLGVAPAVANAIAQALGQRIQRIPFKPESSISQHHQTVSSIFPASDTLTNLGVNS